MAYRHLCESVTLLVKTKVPIDVEHWDDIYCKARHPEAPPPRSRLMPVTEMDVVQNLMDL